MTQFKIYDDNRKERNLFARLIKDVRKLKYKIYTINKNIKKYYPGTQAELVSAIQLSEQKEYLFRLKSIAKEYPK